MCRTRSTILCLSYVISSYCTIRKLVFGDFRHFIQFLLGINATPVQKNAGTNPANVMYSIIIITPPPFQSEGSYDIPPFQKGQPPTVMVAPCLLRLFYCIIPLPSRQEQTFATILPFALPSHLCYTNPIATTNANSH